MAKKRAGKAIRGHIRAGGKLISSPRFRGPEAKAQLRAWREREEKRKRDIEGGFLSAEGITFKDYSSQWFRRRMTKKPRATWQGDEQRLRKYLLPALSEFPIHTITRTQMRKVLKDAQDEHGLSISTRSRIRSLASKIFDDAMNEDPPLVTGNPCSKIKFDDPRQGKKKPVTLEDWDEVASYLRTARARGELHFLIAFIVVMTGMRKSEIIPRRWKDVKWRRGVVLVDTHVEQASLSILPGTKGGQEETREVTAPPGLLRVLELHRKASAFHKETDFILCDDRGEWIRPRKLHDYIAEVSKDFDRNVTLHTLRHTYGRLFAMSNGNLRVLQQLLGHKSGATTQIYSELSNNQVLKAGRNFGSEIVIDDDGNGVNGSGDRRQNDATARSDDE